METWEKSSSAAERLADMVDSARATSQQQLQQNGMQQQTKPRSHQQLRHMDWRLDTTLAIDRPTAEVCSQANLHLSLLESKFFRDDGCASLKYEAGVCSAINSGVCMHTG
jgi:hypothetical protein